MRLVLFGFFSRRPENPYEGLCYASNDEMDRPGLRNSLAELHSASFAWAMAFCRNRELAEEVLQTVYVKVLDGRSRFEGRSEFRTWLFAVIRNAAIDHRRKRWWSSALRLNSDRCRTRPDQPTKRHDWRRNWRSFVPLWRSCPLGSVRSCILYLPRPADS